MIFYGADVCYYKGFNAYCYCHMEVLSRDGFGAVASGSEANTIR